MSLFSAILDKILPHRNSGGPQAPSAPGSAGTVAAPAPTGTTPATAPAPVAPADAAVPRSTESPIQPIEPVDVEAKLNGLAAARGEPLNWRTSIVDLLKLLDLDSNLAARKSLAAELHYSGSTDDSAAMNIWLHRQVMQRLAENGGQVPASLRD